MKKENNIFLQCEKCKYDWNTRNDFITDNNIEIQGYDVNFDNLEHGIYNFVHKLNGCNNLISLEANKFLDLYNGPHYYQNLVNSEICPGYCKDPSNFMKCSNKCSGAYLREILSFIKDS